MPVAWGAQQEGFCAGGTDSGWDLGGGEEREASPAPLSPPFTAQNAQLREDREMVLKTLPAPGASCAAYRDHTTRQAQVTAPVLQGCGPEAGLKRLLTSRAAPHCHNPGRARAPKSWLWHP